MPDIPPASQSDMAVITPSFFYQGKQYFIIFATLIRTILFFGPIAQLVRAPDS